MDIKLKDKETKEKFWIEGEPHYGWYEQLTGYNGYDGKYYSLEFYERIDL